MNRLFQTISVITVLSANLLLAVGIYWFLFPYKTVEFLNQPFPILQKEIKAGDRLTYVVEYCKYTEAKPLISRYFKDGILYVVADIVSASNKMGCHTNNVVVYVPKGLPPGEYTMEIVYHYQLNPVREINISANTEPFIIQ